MSSIMLTTEAARVVQVFWGVLLFYDILFWHKVAKFLHSSCARVLFYFISLQIGEPLIAAKDRSHYRVKIVLNFATVTVFM